MKTNKFKYLLGAIMTLCMVFILMPTTALANGPEVYDGDIYVSNGQYIIRNKDDDSNSEEPVVYKLNKDNPIRGTGEPINRNIYVLDNSELYFDELDLGTGGVYANSKSHPYQWIDINGGTLRAKEMKSNHFIYLESDSDVNIYIEEDLTGAVLYNYADLLDVGGDIIVPRMFLGSDEISKYLYVRVEGNVECYTLWCDNTSVHIEGDLSVSDYETNYYGIYDGIWETAGNYLVFQGAPEFNIFPELYVKGDIIDRKSVV